MKNLTTIDFYLSKNIIGNINNIPNIQHLNYLNLASSPGISGNCKDISAIVSRLDKSNCYINVTGNLNKCRPYLSYIKNHCHFTGYNHL